MTIDIAQILFTYYVPIKEDSNIELFWCPVDKADDCFKILTDNTIERFCNWTKYEIYTKSFDIAKQVKSVLGWEEIVSDLKDTWLLRPTVTSLLCPVNIENGVIRLEPHHRIVRQYVIE
jgi:hypothetical protein